jgi:hypothetical protein
MRKRSGSGRRGARLPRQSAGRGEATRRKSLSGFSKRSSAASGRGNYRTTPLLRGGLENITAHAHGGGCDRWPVSLLAVWLLHDPWARKCVAPLLIVFYSCRVPCGWTRDVAVFFRLQRQVASREARFTSRLFPLFKGV